MGLEWPYGAESRKPTQCIKIGDACIKIGSRLIVLRYGADSMYYDMEPTQYNKIGGNVSRYGAESRKPTQCIKIGDACIRIGSRLNVLRYGTDSMYYDMEPTQYIKIGGNVLRYGAESRKPTQCIKIGNVCIKIWSREPKADSMY